MHPANSRRKATQVGTRTEGLPLALSTHDQTGMKWKMIQGIIFRQNTAICVDTMPMKRVDSFKAPHLELNFSGTFFMNSYWEIMVPAATKDSASTNP